jgi:hypothetical protein
MEEEGVQSEGIRSIEMKAARDAALTNFYDDEPNVDKLSFQEKIGKFNNNPNKAYTQATLPMIRRFNTEYKKRKQLSRPAIRGAILRIRPKRNERNN